MSLSLTKIVIDLLKSEAETKYTAREIAKKIYASHPNECSQKFNQSKNKQIKQATTPEEKKALLIGILVAEIGSQRLQLQKKTPQLKTTEGRPRRYYYTEKSDDSEIETVEDAETRTLRDSPRENELYPLLVQYLKSEYGIYTKRIDERRSINSRGRDGNKWLYPDMVAMEDLTSEWQDKIADCVKQYGDKKAKLWSFEVKCLINVANVRYSFFQAVSNSSWANYGYLVAAELEEKAKKELRMLTSLHGIGFILLDVDNPSESQIIIPAREKNDLDWESINRLADSSKDFLNYIDEVRDFCITGKTKKQDWD